MKLLYSLVLAFTLAPQSANASREKAGVSPVQKVITMLEGMAQKGKSEKHAEQVQYAAYKQFCDDTTAEKSRAISAATEKIETLTADIGKYESDASTLAKEITGHDADVSTWTGDQKAATNVRQIEKTDYGKMHTDYSESIDALQRAIAILKKQNFDRPQAALAQVSKLQHMELIPKEAKHAIELFLAQDPQETAASPDTAAAYEFQSTGVIDMLEKLQDKFVNERSTLEKEEMNSQHAYEMLMQDLKSQIDHATQERSEKTAMRAKKLQAKADAEGDLTDTTKAKDSDQKYHDDLRATCDQKASDFEQRQELRGEEIQAIEKAVEVLKTNVLGKESRLSLLQHLSRRSTALASLRADSSSIAQRKAAEYLQVKAGELQSRVLSVLAGRISEDPFAKVKKMIKDLLVRLMDEANEEAEHKGWCDTELATNEQTRTEKAAAVETLHAEIDALTASIAKLQEDIGELSSQVAFLDKSMAEQTATRADEKASNLATVKDAQEAQTAVAQALTILKEFYAKAGESTALVQKQPAIFDSPYKGMQAENGGVIGMLEVIESDFARLEAETSATEATAQKSYEEFITDSKVDKAAKQKDIEHKTAKKQDESQALISKKSDLDGTQKELDAAMAYYDKLKPSCVDAGTSYDDRVARRKAEIESLQEALRILNGEDLAA